MKEHLVRLGNSKTQQMAPTPMDIGRLDKEIVGSYEGGKGGMEFVGKGGGECAKGCPGTLSIII